MTYDEIKKDVARLLTLPDLEKDPFIMAQAEFAIKRANQDVAASLRLPAVSSVVVPSSNGVIAWPSNALVGRDGIIHLLWKDGASTAKLPIMSEEEAYVRFPQWEDDQGSSPSRAIYDPARKSSGIRVNPYSASTGGTFHLRYVKIPNLMDSPADEPLDGEVPQYHDLISLKAAIYLLEYDYTGGESADYIGFTNIRKLELLSKQYQMRLIEALRSTQPNTIPIRNPFWSIS